MSRASELPERLVLSDTVSWKSTVCTMSYDSDDDMDGNLVPTNMEFWSLEIPPGQTIDAQVRSLAGM